jgi:hypothetical protein
MTITHQGLDDLMSDTTQQIAADLFRALAADVAAGSTTFTITVTASGVDAQCVGVMPTFRFEDETTGYRYTGASAEACGANFRLTAASHVGAKE